MWDAAAARACGLRPLAVGADAVAVSQPGGPRLLRQARLVGVQRVSPDEAAEIGRALALPRGDVDSLPTLADGVTLWCADRDRQYVMTQPTDAETGLFGTPRRMD